MLWCEPFGHTAVENLLDRSLPLVLDSYIFFHDQEPVNTVVYADLFKAAKIRGRDLTKGQVYHGPPIDLDAIPGTVVVSEKGKNVVELCDQYGWKSSYYFYHGWAALDWYRGYNRSYQLLAPEDRDPTTTFFCPNRIIGGERSHRTVLLYWLHRLQLMHNHISAPAVCPATMETVSQISQRYSNHLPDMESVLSQAKLPRLLHGEDHCVMSSYCLGNWKEVHDSFVYVSTETVFAGDKLHLTEKAFKPIALGMPFVLVSTVGSLDYLQSYGFRSFASVWNEDYDTITNDNDRLGSIARLLKDLDTLSISEKKQIWRHCLPIIKHNWNWFYHGGFEAVLWEELTNMVKSWQ